MKRMDNDDVISGGGAGLDWYVGCVLGAPVIRAASDAIADWLPEKGIVPLREERAAAMVAYEGRDVGMVARVPVYLCDPRRRSPVGRARVVERMVLFPGYIFVGVPRSANVRASSVLRGFVCDSRGAQRVPARVVEAVCTAAARGDFDRTRAARRQRASVLRAGVMVSVAGSHPFFPGQVSMIERIDGAGQVSLTIGNVRVTLPPHDVVAVEA